MNRLKIFLLFLAFLTVAALPQSRADETASLQPHRAVYDISLASGKGRNSLTAASGKLTYDFSGSRCEGYATKTRLLAALQSQDGSAQMMDMTSATFESGDGKEMQFVTSSKSGGKVTDFADGVAHMQEDGTLKVTLNKPKKDVLDFPAGALFPAQHSLGILNTAKSGETVFRADLFDGSEGAKKVYATTGIIGKNMHEDISKNELATKAGVASMPRYNVALSFFDTAADKSGEQISLYSIGSVMFENGVTYSMRFDYPEFSLDAKLTLLEILPVGVCK